MVVSSDAEVSFFSTFSVLLICVHRPIVRRPQPARPTQFLIDLRVRDTESVGSARFYVKLTLLARVRYKS